MHYIMFPSIGVVICISMDCSHWPQWYLPCMTSFFVCTNGKHRWTPCLTCALSYCRLVNINFTNGNGGLRQLLTYDNMQWHVEILLPLLYNTIIVRLVIFYFDFIWGLCDRSRITVTYNNWQQYRSGLPTLPTCLQYIITSKFTTHSMSYKQYLTLMAWSSNCTSTQLYSQVHFVVPVWTQHCWLLVTLQVYPLERSALPLVWWFLEVFD